MNLLKNRHWAAIALGMLSGSALAASITCTVTPANSVITAGETLQLAATCEGGALATIEWKEGANTVTGVVPLSGDTSKPMYYTATAPATGDLVFTVAGTLPLGSTDTFGGSSEARVVVKPANFVLGDTLSTRTAAPTTPVDAQCGTPPGAAVQGMPAGLAQCNPGKPALAVSGPQSFTWSCMSLNGGAEANCYALRGYTVSATVGANGSLVGISPAGGGVAAGGTATITVQPALNFSPVFASPCGGAPSGNSFTTGPVAGDCTVSVSFSNTPVNGACGSASNATPVTSEPGANLCLTGDPTVIAAGTAVAHKYTWGCNGRNNGTNTTATACQAPMGYMVTTSAGANGTIGASKLVAGGTTTTFSVTPAAGYMASASGCGGTLNGNTYTTGAITAACTVSATFAVMTVSTTDPGIGAGLWVPPNMPTRTVADQSGDAVWRISYVPGCLNGQTATSSSSGCAGLASYTGTIAGTTTSRTVTMGTGSQLVLRYRSTPTAGTSVKYIRTRSFDGGNVGMNMRVWLSTDPSATYANVAAACKQTSSRTPMVATGPGYCPIAPNTVYYYGMEYDETTALRFQVEETGADFL